MEKMGHWGSPRGFIAQMGILSTLPFLIIKTREGEVSMLRTPASMNCLSPCFALHDDYEQDKPLLL